MSPALNDRSRRSTAWRWFVRGLKALVLVMSLIAAVGILGWLTGRVVSDRYRWSQWLLWIPTLAAIATAAAGLGLTLLWPRKRSLLMGWGVCLAGLIVYFCLIEYWLVPTASGPAPDGLRIVHWNATRDGGKQEKYIDALIAADGDITITSGAGSMPFTPPIWVWNDGSPVSMRPFALATRLPIIRRRYLVNEDDIVVALVELDATEQLGRTLVMYLVDMPSDLRLGRAELTRHARRMIDRADAPPPDVVVGDFNITRGAASLEMMFPGMTHAYEIAGRGYSATFHRGRGGYLLYHIDHILVSDAVRIARYEVIDPGVGRHNMQAATLVPADN